MLDYINTIPCASAAKLRANIDAAEYKYIEESTCTERQQDWLEGLAGSLG